jgi:hypothetical protein
VRARRWSSALFHLLSLSGATLVISGAYMTWATFYAGLVERNGVAGHGKYFIALAVGALIAAALSSKRSLAPLRALVPLAGAIIAAFAIRDLVNLHALIGDRGAAFYVPNDGPGLYVVIAGAALLIASYMVAPRVTEWRRTDLALRAGSLSRRRCWSRARTASTTCTSRPVGMRMTMPRR